MSLEKGTWLPSYLIYKQPSVGPFYIWIILCLLFFHGCCTCTFPIYPLLLILLRVCSLGDNSLNLVHLLIPSVKTSQATVHFIVITNMTHFVLAHLNIWLISCLSCLLRLHPFSYFTKTCVEV